MSIDIGKYIPIDTKLTKGLKGLMFNIGPFVFSFNVAITFLWATKEEISIRQHYVLIKTTKRESTGTAITIILGPLKCVIGFPENWKEYFKR